MSSPSSARREISTPPIVAFSANGALSAASAVNSCTFTVADVTASTFSNPPDRPWRQKQIWNTASTAAPGRSIHTFMHRHGVTATSSRPSASTALRSRMKKRPSAPDIAVANGSGGWQQ